MNIYLIRHGAAEERSTTGSDFHRALTEEGRKAVKKVAKQLYVTGQKIDFIYSSPLLRAKQTAEIFQRTFNLTSKLEIIEDLSPGAIIQEVLRQIDDTHENIALVGHEPDMSKMFCDLCGNIKINFKKGAVAKISFNGRPRIDAGNLEFYLIPKLL